MAAGIVPAGQYGTDRKDGPIHVRDYKARVGNCQDMPQRDRALTGVYMQNDKTRTLAQATDGKTMLELTWPDEQAEETAPVIAPATLLRDAQKRLGKNDKAQLILNGDSTAITPKGEIKEKSVEGIFPKVDQVKPKDATLSEAVMFIPSLLGNLLLAMAKATGDKPVEIRLPIARKVGRQVVRGPAEIKSVNLNKGARDTATEVDAYAVIMPWADKK